MAPPLPVIRAVPQEGESIVVIGNPYGLEGSVSNGTFSAVRDISGYGRIIQITAPISSGSSGSPVVNMAGQVIGVATLQAAEGQSLNFAAERIGKLKVSDLQSVSSLTAESQKINVRRPNVLRTRRRTAFCVTIFSGHWCSEKAVETEPNYPEAWYQAGYCYGVLGRHEEALKASR